jgi:hypothetical protein
MGPIPVVELLLTLLFGMLVGAFLFYQMMLYGLRNVEAPTRVLYNAILRRWPAFATEPRPVPDSHWTDEVWDYADRIEPPEEEVKSYFDTLSSSELEMVENGATVTLGRCLAARERRASIVQKPIESS